MSSLTFCPSLPIRPFRQLSTVCNQRPIFRTPIKRVCPSALLEEDSFEDTPEINDEPIQYFIRDAAVADPPTASELPLFPLQMVLNPGTPIPLHIFELRYRLLFNRVNDGDKNFGIVLYDPDSANLALIGCSAELTRFEPLPDGRIITNNLGRKRFRVVRIIGDKPYTRAMVEFVNDEPPKENLSTLMQEVWDVLQDVLRLSNKLYDKSLELESDLRSLSPGEGKDLRGDADVPEGWPSPKRVEDFSFAICQVLDMPLGEQQRMLQTRDTGSRLRRQKKRLETACQYLAAQVTIKEAGLGQS